MAVQLVYETSRLYGVTLAQIVQFSCRNHEDSRAMKYSVRYGRQFQHGLNI